MKRNYYTIEIPLDFTDNVKEACMQAITEARERARTWCIPCNWEAWQVSENVDNRIIRVKRTHN